MKKPLALFALVLLSACGFEPMYGTHSSGASSGTNAAAGLDAVDIAIIPDASGVALRNELIDRFYSGGYPSSPRYRLTVTPVHESVTDFDITVNSETTSRRLMLATSATLTDLQSGQAVLNRNFTAYSSYNVIGSQFTTRVSEADSRKAAINDLAQQIETQMALYFNR